MAPTVMKARCLVKTKQPKVAPPDLGIYRNLAIGKQRILWEVSLRAGEKVRNNTQVLLQ